jgi:hypothetical protein
MSQLGRTIDERMTFIREKERQLMELEKAINETEKSYDIVTPLAIRSLRPHANCQTHWKRRPSIFVECPKNEESIIFMTPMQ